MQHVDGLHDFSGLDAVTAITGDMQVSPEPFEEALTALETDTDAAPR